MAVARGYAEAGANVIIWFHANKEAHDRAKEIEQEFDVTCKAYQVDVRDAQEVDDAITSQIKDDGFNDRLDIFVANSGVPWTSGAMISADIADYTNLMRVDVDGVFFCARTAGRIWRQQKRDKLKGFTYGSFVATASMSGHIANVSGLTL